MKKNGVRRPQEGLAFEGRRLVPVVKHELETEQLVSGERAANLVALVKLLVPHVVAETLAALQHVGKIQGIVSAGAPVIGSTPGKLYHNAQELADATGVSRYTIQAIRKAGRSVNDPLPKYSTAADVRAWLQRHPNFVARQVFKGGAS